MAIRINLDRGTIERINVLRSLDVCLQMTYENLKSLFQTLKQKGYLFRREDIQCRNDDEWAKMSKWLKWSPDFFEEFKVDAKFSTIPLDEIWMEFVNPEEKKVIYARISVEEEIGYEGLNVSTYLEGEKIANLMMLFPQDFTESDCKQKTQFLSDDKVTEESVNFRLKLPAPFFEQMLSESGLLMDNAILFRLFGDGVFRGSSRENDYCIRKEDREGLEHIADLLSQYHYLYDGAKWYGGTVALRFVSRDFFSKVYIALSGDHYNVWYQDCFEDEESSLNKHLTLGNMWGSIDSRKVYALARDILESEPELQTFLEKTELFYEFAAREPDPTLDLPASLRRNHYRQTLVAYDEEDYWVIAAGFVNYDDSGLAKSYMAQAYFIDEKGKLRVEAFYSMYPIRRLETKHWGTICLKEFQWREKPVTDCFAIPWQINSFETCLDEGDTEYAALNDCMKTIARKGYEYRREFVFVCYDDSNYPIDKEILEDCFVDEKFLRYPITGVFMEFVHVKTGEAVYLNVGYDGFRLESFGGGECMPFVALYEPGLSNSPLDPPVVYEEEGTPERDIDNTELILPLPVFKKMLEDNGLITDTILWDLFSAVKFLKRFHGRGILYLKDEAELLDVLTILEENDYRKDGDPLWKERGMLCYTDKEKRRAVCIRTRATDYQVEYVDRHMNIGYLMRN